MAKKVTQSDIDEWIRLYLDEGLSCRDIAKRCGWGKTTIGKHLDAAGVLRKRVLVSDDMVDEWVVAHANGMSPYELSRAYGFSDETIRAHLKERGVEMNPVGGPVKYDHANDEAWQQMYLSGLSSKEISERVGASETTVSSRLHKMGTAMRKGWKANQRVSDDMVAKWVDQYENEGMSSVRIAKEAGVSSTTVLDYLRKAGVDTGPMIKSEDAREIRRRYEEGETPQSLASEYGVTDQYIRMKIKEAGGTITIPARGFVFDDEALDDWCKRYKSGESMASIAYSAGLKSPDTVRKRLVDRGVEIRERVSTTASSWPEWAIFYYMHKAFPDCEVGNNEAVSTRKGMRYPDVTVVNCDTGLKIAIEYDGAFWHEGCVKRKSDEEKAHLLEEEGFTVYRAVEVADDVPINSLFEIRCSADRRGLGDAIVALLAMLSREGVDVDLERDSPAITELYYAAKNRTARGVEWADLYERQKLSVNSIADMYGTTPTTVSTSLKLQGVEIRHKPIDEPERQKWYEMYEQGISVPSIAKSRGVDKSVIYRHFKKRGIVFERHPKKGATSRDLEWKRLYVDERKSLADIAREYGVSPTTVSNHLQKFGVPRRDNRGR